MANGRFTTGQRFFGLVRQLQPTRRHVLSDAGPECPVRDNEKGQAGDPNWSTVNPDIRHSSPGRGRPRCQRRQVILAGDPAGSVWRPAEVDVSIRPGWFLSSS